MVHNEPTKNLLIFSQNFNYVILTHYKRDSRTEVTPMFLKTFFDQKMWYGENGNLKNDIVKIITILQKEWSNFCLCNLKLEIWEFKRIGTFFVFSPSAGHCGWGSLLDSGSYRIKLVTVDKQHD